MLNDLQLSDQDEVLLESLVLAASDNVARAPASDRDQFAPERRRAFVETSGNENVYLGTGSEWVDVSENTGLLSKLFSGGDGNFDSVNTNDSTINNSVTYPDGVTHNSSPSSYIEDANSPFSETGGTSYTLTLDGSYDAIWVIADVSEESGNSDNLGVQVNGHTDSNYDSVNYDGSSTSSNGSFLPIAPLYPGEDIITVFEICRRGDTLTIDNRLGGREYEVNVGEYTASGAKISQLSLVSDYDQRFDILDMEVRGVSVK